MSFKVKVKQIFKGERKTTKINLQSFGIHRAFISFLKVQYLLASESRIGSKILSLPSLCALLHSIYIYPTSARQIMVDPNSKICHTGDETTKRRQNHTFRRRFELIECKEARARIMVDGCRKKLRDKEKERERASEREDDRWIPDRFQNEPSQTHINWLRGMNPFTF